MIPDRDMSKTDVRGQYDHPVWRFLSKENGDVTYGNGIEEHAALWAKHINASYERVPHDDTFAIAADHEDFDGCCHYAEYIDWNLHYSGVLVIPYLARDDK
jgi:hypothetical protein